MGRLIPAGTGMEFYRNVKLRSEEPPLVEGPAEVNFDEADVFDASMDRDEITT